MLIQNASQRSHFRLDDAMAAVPKIQLMYACVLDLYQQAHAKVGCLNIAGKTNKQELTLVFNHGFSFHF